MCNNQKDNIIKALYLCDEWCFRSLQFHCGHGRFGCHDGIHGWSFRRIPRKKWRSQWLHSFIFKQIKSWLLYLSIKAQQAKTKISGTWALICKWQDGKDLEPVWDASVSPLLTTRVRLSSRSGSSRAWMRRWPPRWSSSRLPDPWVSARKWGGSSHQQWGRCSEGSYPPVPRCGQNPATGSGEGLIGWLRLIGYGIHGNV